MAPALEALQPLLDRADGAEIPLPSALAEVYGSLRLPLGGEGRAHVVANFVSSLDGVVAFEQPGTGGGEISGFNPHDRMVMGLLRSVSDAIVVGAGTLRDAPSHVWTPEGVFRPLEDAYHQVRRRLGLAEQPLNVVVTAQGSLDFGLPLFVSGKVPVVVLTTVEGKERLAAQVIPAGVRLLTGPVKEQLSASTILELLAAAEPTPPRVILVEGGPHLIGQFFAERRLDELFLTLSPQIVGRDAAAARLGLVAGKAFGPTAGMWARLIGVKLGGDHLFLRYAFPTSDAAHPNPPD